MLKNLEWDILGFILLFNIIINNQMFANDATLYLKDILENLIRAMTIFTKYYQASIIKANWYKTYIISIASHVQ